jgi:hypothetical protein
MALKIAKEEVSTTTPATTDHRRSEEFQSKYANNVFLQSTAWDLTMNFGEVDQTIGPNTVIQHTGVTLPWPQVKILQYYLQVHLAAHELDHGRITIPKGVIVDIPAPTKEQIKEYPNAVQLHNIWSKLHDDFLTANPEAAPAKS